MDGLQRVSLTDDWNQLQTASRSLPWPAWYKQSPFVTTSWIRGVGMEE